MIGFILGGICGLIVGMLAGVFMLSILSMNRLKEEDD